MISEAASAWCVLMHSLRRSLHRTSGCCQSSASRMSANSAAHRSCSAVDETTPRSGPPQPRVMRGRRIVASVSMLAALSVYAAMEIRRGRPEFVTLVAPSGAWLRVEVARTPEARARGLSGRDQLSSDGLLLEWPHAGSHPIWMAGMRFPLDLVWLDAYHRVVAIVERVPPCAGHPCPLFQPTDRARSVGVLELPAGMVAQVGVTLGSHFKAIKPGALHTVSGQGLCIYLPIAFRIYTAPFIAT